MFIAAPNENKPCSLLVEGNLLFIYTIDCAIAIKMNKPPLHTVTWMNLKSIRLKEANHGRVRNELFCLYEAPKREKLICGQNS